MKKLLVLLLTALMLCSAFVLPALAEGADTAADAAVAAVDEAADAAADTAAEAVDEAADTAETAVEAAAEAAAEAEAEAEEEAEEAKSWTDTAFEEFGKTKWYVYVVIALLAVLGVVGTIAVKNTDKSRMSTRVMSEGAMMIALATVLSLIKLWEMPYGGSVTMFSMLPIVLMSYRHGPKWGLFTAFTHSILQLIMGIKNVGYCATIGAQIACILLDYTFAFSVLGLASLFSKPFKNRTVGVCLGTAIVGALRFFCHFLSGIFLWGSYQPTDGWISKLPTWLYSIVYNGMYMLPEVIITVIGAVLLVRGAKRLFDRQAA